VSGNLLEAITNGRKMLKAIPTRATTTLETTTTTDLVVQSPSTQCAALTSAAATSTTSETEAPSAEYDALTDSLLEEINLSLALLNATTTTTDVAHEARSPPLRAMLERTASERRRSICGTDSESVGYESSDDQKKLDE
jgi:hypothetical protein